MNLKPTGSKGICHRIAAAIWGIGVAIHGVAQDTVTEQKLLGSWSVSGSPSQETFTFKGNSELVVTSVQTKRDGKPTAPITHASDAAYKFGPGACNVGQESGNLFLARRSERCCFKIYQIGQTLVFDEVRTGSRLTLPLCESKTLRRTSK